MADDLDAIVIGAGVIGASVTLELARSGRRVLCLDAGPGVGQGSTSASAAVIRFHYTTMDAVLTSWEAAHLWWDLPGHLGHVDPDGLVAFHRTGGVILDYPNHNKSAVVANFAELGIPCDVLTPAELKERFPAFDTGDFSPPKPLDDPAFADDPTSQVGAYYCSAVGFIDDPLRAAVNIMYAARQEGAELRLNTMVTAIRHDDHGVAGVTLASGDEIDARIVVNVAGPAAAHVNGLAGVTDDMTVHHGPLRQEVHITPEPPGFTLETGAVVADVGTGTYFRPHFGQTLFVGGTEAECDGLHWVDDPYDFNDRPTVEGFERNTWRVARRMPDLPIPHKPVGIGALYDASEDWTPIYDKSSLPGFYMACGSSGNQFKNAPMAGKFLLALIDAAAEGIDHDLDPITVTGPMTGRAINLAAFSRRRPKAPSSGTVMG